MKKPQHLEQAGKEVKSKKAQKEICIARTAIKELAKMVKELDRSEDTIRAEIMALEEGRQSLYLADKLKRLLESRDK